ncbi:V4R domain-containing protein [Roseomonas sp. BN140053]|uniref:V4R domain-containing protein n=1 Tax=Roseomonas sp. BN140053 TaxID=3391898 RepID=UPI0039ECEDC1
MTGFRNRLQFDAARGEYRDGAIRYMMLRHDALMGLFARLPEAERLAALDALGASVREFGGRSVESYRAAGADDAARMMDTIAATAPELGWGIWRFSREGEALVLAVENSPFAAGIGTSAHPVCHAIVGMLTALGPILLGKPASVEETQCAAVAGGSTCRFRMQATVGN